MGNANIFRHGMTSPHFSLLCLVRFRVTGFIFDRHLLIEPIEMADRSGAITRTGTPGQVFQYRAHALLLGTSLQIRTPEPKLSGVFDKPFSSHPGVPTLRPHYPSQIKAAYRRASRPRLKASACCILSLSPHRRDINPLPDCPGCGIDGSIRGHRFRQGTPWCLDSSVTAHHRSARLAGPHSRSSSRSLVGVQIFFCLALCHSVVCGAFLPRSKLVRALSPEG